MFFNKRKRYNGDVAVLLPAFRIDLKEAGIFKVLDSLDTCYDTGHSVYQAAVIIAYAVAVGMFDEGLTERSKELFNEIIPPIEKDWIEKGLLTQALCDDVRNLALKRHSDLRSEDEN